MNAAAPAALPPLRQELALHRGPEEAGGAPTWTLHDPADNRFFQLGWAAFEILSRWHLGRVDALLDALRRDTTLQVEAADVEDVHRFLAHHHLLAARNAEDSARLARAAEATRMSRPMWLLKHYLFFRVPLVRPMSFLRAALPRIRWLFTRQFWWLVFAMALSGLFLVSQQWDAFLHTFAGYSGWHGLVGIGVALSVAKIAHELGHAFTAYRHGCRVPHMGVAFMVMVPMLYTDTNEAWKLASRRARLEIGAAGMAAEIALAACATLLWSFLPDGPLRAGVFLLATSTWLITLAINLSPFMRFDGYFLLSDWLGMPNLHERAFAMGRWHLREALFGWGDVEPESFAPARRRFLIGFAYATWLYRLVLFLGIALLVYHLFFKALGILLMIVELGWFIAYPVQREMKQWWQRRADMRWNRATRRTVLLCGVALIVLCAPWPRGVGAPAMLGATQAQWLYAPAPARVGKVHVQPDQSVQAGQVLVELDSAELRRDLALARAREEQLRWQVQQQAFEASLQERGDVLRQRWEATRTEVEGMQALSRQLVMRAPFAGRVADFNPALQAGVWLRRGESLLRITSPQGVRVEAYVSEQDLPRIAAGDAARFVADQPGMPTVRCTVESIDRIALATLDHAALASPFGGPLPANMVEGSRLVPRDATFRVRLGSCVGMADTPSELPGKVVIGRAWRSFAGQARDAALSAWHRESGL